ncbi:hypothetical protein U1Q18_011677, partial [Sarracenia purpurea var. burkii]
GCSTVIHFMAIPSSPPGNRSLENRVPDKDIYMATFRLSNPTKVRPHQGLEGAD